MIWRITLVTLAALLVHSLLTAQEESAAPQPADNAQPAVDESPVIPLKKHLRMVIRPTLLGLVPPDNPEHLGEVFARVTGCLPGSRISLRYEIKEQGIWDATEADAAAASRARPVTRFRRGTVVATGISDSASIFPPLLWDDGDFSSATGLLWLPAETFSELLLTGSAQWDPSFGNRGIAEDLRQRYGSAEAGLVLEKREVRYPVDVNGVRTRLNALEAVDSLGAARYIILDDEDNPLVLKLTLNGDTDHGIQSAGNGLVDAGAGYAVVSIDY